MEKLGFTSLLLNVTVLVLTIQKSFCTHEDFVCYTKTCSDNALEYHKLYTNEEQYFFQSLGSSFC
jgi:hypothetical protein